MDKHFKERFKNIQALNGFMGKKYFMDVVINKERLNKGNIIFVSYCPSLGIASQGKDLEEALKNIKEAIGLYLEEQPEKYKELVSDELPIFSVVEVTKAASIVR